MEEDIDKILTILKYDMQLAKQLAKSQNITSTQLSDRWKDNNPEVEWMWYYSFFKETLSELMNDDDGADEVMDRIIRISEIETPLTLSKFTII